MTKIGDYVVKDRGGTSRDDMVYDDYDDNDDDDEIHNDRCKG